MPNPLDWLDEALDDLDRRGLRRTLHERWSPQTNIIDFPFGELVVNFGSNDYLGLANDAAVCEAARQAILAEGWAQASPLVCGRGISHFNLERLLAGFEHTESALLFPTGYAANVGAITALVGKGDAIYSDERNHASIIDGCRLSGAAIHVYRHGDADCLGELLRGSASFGRRLIVTDGLFSMGGDLAPLEQIVSLAAQFNCMVLVDEAHATGVLGKRGQGVCEYLHVEDGVHVRVGTLSKALGSVGGFVAGSQALIDWLTNRARTYVFSTAMPAAAAAASRKAMRIVEWEPERREQLLANACNLRDRLSCAGFALSLSQSQIIPIVIGEPARAMNASAELREMGFFVPAIRPPSVPPGQSLLRISVTYLHTEQQIDDLVAALRAVIR